MRTTAIIMIAIASLFITQVQAAETGPKAKNVKSSERIATVEKTDSEVNTLKKGPAAKNTLSSERLVSFEKTDALKNAPIQGPRAKNSRNFR